MGWGGRAEHRTPCQEPAALWETLWLASHGITGAARCPHRAGRGEKPVPHLHWWKEESSSCHTSLLAKALRHLVGGSAKPAGSLWSHPAQSCCLLVQRPHVGSQVCPSIPLTALTHFQPLSLCFPAPSPLSGKRPLIASSRSPERASPMEKLRADVLPYRPL